MALQSEKPVRNYNCTQAELYAVCKIGLESYRENTTDFSNFKGYYNNAWGNTFESEIEAAEQLPSLQQRGERSEISNVELAEKGDECLVAWQRLKRHTADAFPENQQKPKLESAGQLLYEKAANQNWDVLKQLMQQGETFIADNLADLTAGNNMPAIFQAQFTTLKDEYNAIYDEFTDARQDSEEQTTEKINANNGIYNKLIAMFKDGQEIYRTDRAKQERFIFEQVLGIVRGSKGKEKTHTVAPSSRTVIEKVVANSSMQNLGGVTLWVASGDVPTQPPGAIQLDSGTEATRPEGSSTITVFNNDAVTAGSIQVRITVN